MSPHDPNQSPGKGRRLVLRKIERPDGKTPTSGDAFPNAESSMVPSAAPISGDGGVSTVRRPPMAGVSALTASAAASGYTPMPAALPSEARLTPHSQTQVSFPPVVAASERPPGMGPSGSTSTSSTRAVVMGAAVGFAIVAGLVLVTRIAHIAQPSTASSVEPPVAVVVSAPMPAPSALPPPIVVAVTALPTLAPRAGATLPGHPSGVNGATGFKAPPKAHAPSYAPAKSSAGAAAVDSGVTVAASAAAAASGEASPDDTGSLVPVIPPSSAPEVDPLVKAVQHDIEEEEHSKGK
jgi:hypothetical protein